MLGGLVLLLGTCQMAWANPAPWPLITPAPLERRDDANDPYLLGYYYNTVYSTWSKDLCETISGITRTYTSSAGFYECCGVGNNCNMNVGCSGSYLLKATGSAIDCFNVVSDISATCTWDVMFASAGATAAQKYIYCAEGGVAGTTYYRANPTSTSSSSQTPTPTPTQSPTPSPTSASKKAPIGAIVGGVIGGLTVITLLVLGLLLLLKKKKQVTVQQPYVTAPELSRGDGVMGSPPAQFQYATASKPTLMEHTSPVSASSQYNQNYSDQHAVQPIPYGQHQQQQPQQYQSGVPQDWVSAAPHAVEMESPGSSPPPQYGNFNPNPTR